MIHRHLYDVLTLGITTITDHPEMLDDIFSAVYEVESTELVSLKRHYRAHPPSVVNGYARQDTRFPAIAIILGQEAQTDDFLGDYVSQVDDEGSSTHKADIHGGIWQCTYHIEVYAENPDVTLWYYEIVKQILQLAHEYFVEHGIFSISMSGADMAPDPAYLPEHLFGRQLTFTAKHLFSVVERDSLLGKAFRIAGVHLDSDGSPSDPGGAYKSLITID